MSISKLETNQLLQVITRDVALKSGFLSVEYDLDTNSFVKPTRWTRLNHPQFIVQASERYDRQNVYVTADKGCTYHLMSAREKSELQVLNAKNPPVKPSKLTRRHKSTTLSSNFTVPETQQKESVQQQKESVQQQNTALAKSIPAPGIEPIISVDPQSITAAINTKDRKSLKIIADILYEKLKKDYPCDQQSYSFFTKPETPVLTNAMQALRIYFFLDTHIDLLNIDLHAGKGEGILIEHNDKILKLLNDAYNKSEHVKNLVSGSVDPSNPEEENLSRFFKHKDMFALIADVYEDKNNYSLFKDRLSLGLKNLTWLADRKIRQRLEASLISYQITNSHEKRSRSHVMLQQCYITKLKALIKEHHQDVGDLKREKVKLARINFSETDYSDRFRLFESNVSEKSDVSVTDDSYYQYSNVTS